MFKLSDRPLDEIDLKHGLADPRAGGCVVFEGWVRNHNEGRKVTRLQYEAYAPLALKAGEQILAEAREKFDILDTRCIHRVGELAIGELAVWIGVIAAHRSPAFDACQYIINQLKRRVPIWKKEYYLDGDSGWVNCRQCARIG